MENHCGSIPLEHLEQTLAIADVDDRRGEVRVREGGPKLLFGLEDAVLAMAKEHQERRACVGDLAAQLEPDRPARAGDQDAPIRQVRRGADGTDDLRPPEQVGNVDITKPLNTHSAVE